MSALFISLYMQNWTKTLGFLKGFQLSLRLTRGCTKFQKITVK